MKSAPASLPWSLAPMASFWRPRRAFAVQPDEMLKDPAAEARARKLSSELRCLVCQNESIDDSNAPLAKDLRLLVRERITAGDSDQQILDFLKQRYGDFVLLRPPLGADAGPLRGAFRGSRDRRVLDRAAHAAQRSAAARHYAVGRGKGAAR